MTLRLNGSTSGYTEIDAPATGGNNTLVLPTGNGTADQALVTNGSGALSFADRGRMVLDTAKASTSGTSVDFTGIPSWVKRVTIQLRGVSLSGTSSLLIQLGSTTFASTGYVGTSLGQNSSSVAAGLSSTSGVPLYLQLAGGTVSGLIRVETLGSNSWVLEGNAKFSTTEMCSCAGDVTLSGTLDRIRITTVNGTDTFDAGSINILYEG
jgi:hypothetical protein